MILLLAAAILFIVGWLQPSPAGILNTDPEQWLINGHLGLFSKISTYLWLTAALVCLHAAFSLRERAPAWASFFQWASALNWLFLLLDFFLIHEALQSLGIPRWALYATYAILTATLLGIFHSLILRTNVTLLTSALACFACATLSKVVIRPESYYIIEAVKLAALTCWTGYFVGVSLMEIRQPHSLGKSARMFSAQQGATAVAIIAAYGLMFAGVRLSHLFDSPSELVREPTILLKMPLYAGLLSNVGVLLMSGSGLSSLLAAFGARGGGQTSGRQFLLWGGAFTLWLSIDDYYLIHERALMAVGIPQFMTFAIYGIAGLGILILYWQMPLRQNCEGHLLVLGGILLAASALVDLDLFGVRAYTDPNDWLEDALKLLGMLSWSMLLLRNSSRYLIAEQAEQGALPDDDHLDLPQ